MFGHSKKKAAAEMMAPQWMKILVESRDIVNRTTEPDVFFSRYDTVKEKAEQLARTTGSNYFMSSLYAMLEQCYREMDDFKKAYHYASMQLQIKE